MGTPPPITHRPPAGHAGPALQKFPVGRHPCAPPQTVPSGGAEPRPYGGQGVPAGGASGKSAKRCLWWKKRADFEEVPRLADTAVAGNRMARRWATAAPYGSSTGKRCVGADAYIGPAAPASLLSVGAGFYPAHLMTYRTHGRARRPCPTKISCRAAPMCAAAGHTNGRGRAPPLLTTRKHPALLAMCHCEASAHTGCGNPSPPAFAQGYYGFPRCFAPRNDRRGFRQAQQNRRFWRKRRFCSFRGRGRMYGKEKYERLLIAGSQGHDAYDRQHTGQSGQNNIQEHTSDLLIRFVFRKLTG